MKKRTKTILMLAAVLLILGGLYCVFILPLNGSIIHKLVLTQRVRDYVADTYGEGFTVDRAVYNFKMNNYLCHVRSDTSADTYFSVFEERGGTLSDYYELEVLQKENTIWRLEREMDEQMERDFIPAYPWECVNYMCNFEKEPLDKGTPEVRERFALDMTLNMQSPPVPLELLLWVVRDDPSWETLAESLQEAVRATDRLGWDISYYSITLHAPFEEDDDKPGNAITDFCVYQLPRTVIEAEGLAAYLEENHALYN